MSLRATFALAVAAVLVPSAASACSGKLSGALTGAFDCTVAVTSGQGGQFSIVIAPSGKVDGVERFLPATFELAGRPAVGILTLATLTGARASIQTAGKATYRAGLAAGKRQGEVTLALETVERETRGGFTVRGSLNARLAPASGKGAPVVVDVAF